MSDTKYKIYHGEFNSSISTRTDNQYSDIRLDEFKHYIKKNSCDIVHDVNHDIYCIYPSTNVNNSYLHGIAWSHIVYDYKNYIVTNQYCIDCEDCFNCINCDSCLHCKLCRQCVQCKNCDDCINSMYCSYCTKCDNSKHCIACKDSSNCMSCESVRNCVYCSNAIKSKLCTDSFNCFNCNSCNNVKHEFGHKVNEIV